MGCKMRTTDGKNQRVRNRELEQAILPVRSNSRAGELRLENTDAGGRNESLRLTKKAAERTNHEQTKNHECTGQSQQIEDRAHPMRDSEATEENLRQRQSN
jgi:hypothetical protein